MPYELDHVPAGLLELGAERLHEILPGPTLIHLTGRRPESLFVCVLLHGNEDTGWLAVRELLREYAGCELPRALSLFVGNVQAARYSQRFLDGQPDYNRIWTDMPGIEHMPERNMTRRVVEIMKARGVFASVDIHNNTGINPHYVCVRRFDHRFFQLATLFSRTVVYFTKPDGVQCEAFSAHCPAVTLECGQPGQTNGVAHAVEYLKACLNLTNISDYPIAPQDINLFHTVATVKVPRATSFGFDSEDVDIRLLKNLDHLNFHELPVNTVLGWIKPGSNKHLEVWDETGHEARARFLQIYNSEIRTLIPVMPSMLTVNANAIRQDCLGYFMESGKEFYEFAMKRASENVPCKEGGY
jgi:hypothetical protein